MYMNKAVEDYASFNWVHWVFGLDTLIVYLNSRQPGIWDNWRMPEKLENQ